MEPTTTSKESLFQSVGDLVLHKKFGMVRGLLLDECGRRVREDVESLSSSESMLGGGDGGNLFLERVHLLWTQYSRVISSIRNIFLSFDTFFNNKF